MWERLYVSLVFFLGNRPLIFETAQQRPTKKYISGLVLDVAQKIDSNISPAPALIFTRVSKSAKFGF